jgi:hypothetical protein
MDHEALTRAGARNSIDHESTKVRKHEKDKAHSFRVFDLSCFRDKDVLGARRS